MDYSTSSFVLRADTEVVISVCPQVEVVIVLLARKVNTWNETHIHSIQKNIRKAIRVSEKLVTE